MEKIDFEDLKILASTISDLTKYICQIDNLIEQFDETLEYYDFLKWLSNDNKVCKVQAKLGFVSDFFFEELNNVTESFWNMFKDFYETNYDIFSQEFGNDIQKDDIDLIREYIEKENIFFDIEFEYTISENYENIKKAILFSKEKVFAENKKDFHRPFLNDNFVFLKLLSDNQNFIEDKKCIKMSLRDLSKLSGFGLNKVQTIMSSLIKWEYVYYKDNKYFITDEGKKILNLLLKIPTVKIK